MNQPEPAPTYLVTGASGYIGGRLIPLLLAEGANVRILARHPDGLRQREWYGDVEIVQGDAMSPADMDRAMAGVCVAYYLMHSLSNHDDFEQTERDMALTFAHAARDNGVGRIIYLGGMIPTGPPNCRRICVAAPRSARSCGPVGYRQSNCARRSSSDPGPRVSRCCAT